MKKKSYFKRVIEQKGLLKEKITLSCGACDHTVKVSILVELIEISSRDDKTEIRKAFKLIEERNGDLMGYLRFIYAGILI